MQFFDPEPGTPLYPTYTSGSSEGDALKVLGGIVAVVLLLAIAIGCLVAVVMG
ncbi:MAG: hypothetical protein QM750_11745 [Rubrivivax sp.]